MNPEQIEKLTDKQFNSLFIELHKKIKENPIKNFVEAPGFIDTILAPGQQVLFKLVMGYPLDNTKKHNCINELEAEDNFVLIDALMTEVELYEYMTGKIYDSSAIDTIRDITLIVGRRGGKTMCAAILAIYCALKKNWSPMLGRKKTATILVVSHTTEFSNETIDEIRAMIADSPILSKLINKKAKNTQSTINLKIPFLDPKTKKITFSYVRIRSNAASSKSSRGSACPVIICDEIAFWGSDPNSKETDKEIVRAIKPSMLQFEDDAMWIELSTPNIRQGVLHEKWDNRENLSKRAVLLKAPSWVFNNRYRAIDYYDFWKEDQENFDREFRANFVDSLGSFLNPDYIDLAVMPGVSIIPPDAADLGVKYICAIDAAFKGDIFTVNVIGLHQNRIKQYATLGFKGNRKTPVRSNEVAAAVAKLNLQYKFDIVYGDQFSFQPLKEIFAEYGITLVEKVFTNTFKQKIYKNLKYLLECQQVDLLDHKPTIKELKEIQVEVRSTGTISIMHPPGGHDDYADSLSIAVFIAKEQAGELGVSFEVAGSKESYDIATDLNGVCFTAPPAEIVGESYGYGLIDNIDQYARDPDTGKLRKIEDIEGDEEEGMHFAFG